MRFSAGLLLSPLITAAVGAGVVGVTSASSESAVLSLVLLVLTGYATALFFGWPLLLLLRRLSWINPLSLALAGSGASLLLSLLLSLVHPGRSPWHHALLNFASIGAPLGALGGIVFWWLSVRKTGSASRHRA